MLCTRADNYLFEHGVCDKAALAECEGDEAGAEGEDLVEQLDIAAGTGELQLDQTAQGLGIQRRLYLCRTAQQSNNEFGNHIFPPYFGTDGLPFFLVQMNPYLIFKKTMLPRFFTNLSRSVHVCLSTRNIN